MFPKEVLNKLKWTGNPELKGVEIWILHRGAPEDRKVIEGIDVKELENSFFTVEARRAGDEANEQSDYYDNILNTGSRGGGGSSSENGGSWEISGAKETRIPYHRIQRILLDKKVIYDRSEYS